MLKHLLLTLATLLLVAHTASARTIVFASDATWPPMEMVDANKNIVGFCPDLVRAIGKAAGFTAVLKSTAWDGIFAGLAAGKYDAIASSVSITKKRKRVMDFSDPYFDVTQGVVTRKGSKIKTVADLEGKKIGAQLGTTGYFSSKKIKNAQPESYDEIGLAIENLNNGRIDAVICDNAVAAGYALQNENYKNSLKLAFMIIPDKPELLGIAVKKGNKEVLELINKGLKAVKASGEYDRIFKKWFPME